MFLISNYLSLFVDFLAFDSKIYYISYGKSGMGLGSQISIFEQTVEWRVVHNCRNQNEMKIEL